MAPQHQQHALSSSTTPTTTTATTSPPPLSRPFLSLHYGVMMLLTAALIPWTWSAFARGSPVPTDAALLSRDDSPVDVCFRWSQQSAIVNGTLYLYGGEASTQSGQTENTWNNDFLTLDLTKTWNIAAPALQGLPQPSGPPPVALGYLWNSWDSLFLYGGEFSWKPPVSPSPVSMWEYQIGPGAWVEYNDPETSGGVSAPSNDQPVQRAAEGAGVSVPSLGRGFYFGGHLDGYTTPGWSQSIPRVYLQSLLEYTYPGATNEQVTALENDRRAGTAGVWRNITQGGLQSEAGFTERADGLLIYVPGFSDEGILLALAGGTNQSFTQMNVIDVYDISTSQWYRQSTAGAFPKTRVNPCATMAVAPDGSSYNIYMFGGQALLPYGNQEQYSDTWILSLPSFTWIQVDTSSQSVPYGRSGHTCNMWNAQMVVVGGYVGNQLSCESPGVYVFDMSKTQWVSQYSVPSDADPSGNPFNQQPAQHYNSTNSGGLAGSYGYTVPEVVISVIGGGPQGGATATAPVVQATGGPLATGAASTYPDASSSGSSQASSTGATDGSNGSSGSNGSTSTFQPHGNNTNGNDGNSKGGSTNVAAIVVGVLCGLLFCVVCYLAFCAFVYRKQLQLYKNHAEMAQQQQQQHRQYHDKNLGYLSLSADVAIAKERGSNSTPRESGSQQGSIGARPGSHDRPTTGSYQSVRRSSDQISTDDLLTYQEPSFVGIMLNPRRSLRVVNRD